jgi:hypothetical protein
MKIEWVGNKTYQVTDGFIVWFQGNLPDCKEYFYKKWQSII